MAVSELADLEITLHRSSEGDYSAALRFERPQSDGFNNLLYDLFRPLRFDFERLAALSIDAAAYGRALSEMFFIAPLRQRFAEHRAQLNGAPMRVRLAFGTDVLEVEELRLAFGASMVGLQDLRWEALRDPEVDAPLFSTRMPFSRYVGMTTTREREASRKYRDQLRMLVAIANPSRHAPYRLAPINTGEQLSCARQILDTGLRTELVDDAVTLDRLTDELRRGCDVLFLTAHGAAAGGEHKLGLANGRGEFVWVPADELLQRIANLNELPRLVVLMSCESATLGQRVAQAGVPAVLVMHGSIPIDTATRFLTVFVAQLRQSGVIDAAVAAARYSIGDRPEFWMPVLFMRPRDGVIWQRPATRNTRRTFEKWGTLIANLRSGSCVPILGPGLLNPLIGSPSEIGARLAEKHELGIRPSARESLPQVAQILQLRTDRTMLRSELSAVLRENLVANCPDVIPADNSGMLLFSLLKDANSRLWRGQLDPHSVLAKFPCPIFVNAAPDPLLEVALKRQGKHPQVMICPWTSELDWATGSFDPDDPLFPDHTPPAMGRRGPQTNIKFQPNAERPLVYHPFGLLQVLSSLVLTEDDYFQYLVGNTMGHTRKLPALRYSLTNTALLFIGFRLDDWSFRVLLREILQLKSSLINSVTHIGVQIDPDNAHGSVEDSYTYLEEQLRAYNITIHEEPTEEFISHLDAASGVAAN
jgi:hypothetical protein